MDQTQAVSALKFARRAVGFSAQGALCSQTVANNALRQIQRTVGVQLLPSTVELLNDLMVTHVLPTEKRAHLAMEEINKVYAHVRRLPQDTLTDEQDETPQPAPGQ